MERPRQPGFRTAANDNFKELERPEAPVILDKLKAHEIRRIAEEVRMSGEIPYLWSDTKLQDMRNQVSAHTAADALTLIEMATEESIRTRPTYYLALLDLIDEAILTVQDKAT